MTSAAVDLAELTATELLEAYAAGDTTPVEVTEACLARIEVVEPAINAVLLPLAEQALQQAAESTRRWQLGQARALEGVPYGLKDIIATAGIRTTGGSALYKEHVPTESAVLAERLEAAGGVLLAKLQTFEFACGGPDNRTFGQVRNPWDTTRTTGGSSSGPGAAVAAGELPVAIGTESPTDGASRPASRSVRTVVVARGAASPRSS
jgi:aspartyl-tRNA(Asn)/glutamyl-tRNA(Gln) amidotransferase subunit A